ncbi:predicted protein [Botrytis cinerea T4]|uniref:Uncharacterized protein n=1 Tax=Botryotinia fuckeliana (strain T4) TaxID=999810 RepID=G2YE72_BOTF4|nr:predicted protein [Botrytis cinerea T4]
MHRLTQATRIRWPAESVIYITLTESPKSPKTCNTCASASASADVEIPTGAILRWKIRALERFSANADFESPNFILGSLRHNYRV